MIIQHLRNNINKLESDLVNLTGKAKSVINNIQLVKTKLNKVNTSLAANTAYRRELRLLKCLLKDGVADISTYIDSLIKISLDDDLILRKKRALTKTDKN